MSSSNSFMSVLSLRLLLLTSTSVLYSSTPPCRFAFNYAEEGILSNSTERLNFLSDYRYYESKFAEACDISLSCKYQTTYDGSELDYDTGNQYKLRFWSAASKEALHIMYLIIKINASLNTNDFASVNDYLQNLETKFETYRLFNKTYPGFGGFLPWFEIPPSNQNEGIIPSNNWNNSVPALDNGELYWSIYGIKWLLNSVNNSSVNETLLNTVLNSINSQLSLMELTGQVIFYDFSTNNGNIRWTSDILDNQLDPFDPNQVYSGGSRPGDPYEGELFQWFLDLKSVPYTNTSDWNTQRNNIWSAAQKNRQKAVYTYTNNDTNTQHSVIVQKGYWFSSHEQWKMLLLPYLDIKLLYQLFKNCEIVRTINSAKYVRNIGSMYASVNNVISNNSESITYESACGIPEIASYSGEYDYNIVTPYSIFNVFLYNESIASVWLLNILKGYKMQNLFGSTESINIEGNEISPLVTWGSKMTTFAATYGGVSEYTRKGLENEGLYNRFINVMTQEYENIFGSNPNNLVSDSNFMIPSFEFPTQQNMNFDTCSNNFKLKV